MLTASDFCLAEKTVFYSIDSRNRARRTSPKAGRAEGWAHILSWVGYYSFCRILLNNKSMSALRNLFEFDLVQTNTHSESNAVLLINWAMIILNCIPLQGSIASTSGCGEFRVLEIKPGKSRPPPLSSPQALNKEIRLGEVSQFVSLHSRFLQIFTVRQRTTRKIIAKAFLALKNQHFFWKSY